MKATLRIPTNEQYAYIEVEVEGTAEEVLDEYNALTSRIKEGVGLDTKDFNKVLDEYLTTGKIGGDPGVLTAMNTEQQAIVQAIKRSRARTSK